MNTDTPRTDALMQYLRPRENYMISHNGDWSNLSRQLERELADRDAQITALKSSLVKACEPVEKLANTMDRIVELERELTEANAKIKELTFGWAADREELQAGFNRYEKLRKLNPHAFSYLWTRATTGEKRFDELVDEL